MYRNFILSSQLNSAEKISLVDKDFLPEIEISKKAAGLQFALLYPLSSVRCHYMN